MHVHQERGVRVAGPGGRSRWHGLGPGGVVAAAFVGPGTVTTATLAGAGYGYALLWALLFSIAATLVLQEMSARLGLATGTGLGEAVRARFGPGVPRFIALALIISAIGIGNAAYEAGNLLGAALGMRGIAGGSPAVWVPVFAGFAAVLLWSGRYAVIERVLVGMVVLMSLLFLATALALAPPAGELLRGLLVPSVPDDGGALLLVLALIGTTVVPYNLFLHAAAVGERWRGGADLPAVRTDLAVAIALGGVISMAIVVTAAAALQHGGTVGSASEMAAQLEPLLGRWAGLAFAAGLFAAGMTSAITAPLAAAWAVSGALGWQRDLRSGRFRAVWCTVLFTGVTFAIAGTRPAIPLGFGEVSVIVFAQVANAILLPAMALFLLLAVNDRSRMQGMANGRLLNVLGGAVVLVTIVIGVTAVVRAFG